MILGGGGVFPLPLDRGKMEKTMTEHRAALHSRRH